MKNFFLRLLRVFAIKGDKALKKFESSIEVYEYELQKSKESLEKLSQSQSKLRADKKIVEDKVVKVEEYVKQLEMILNLAADQEDYELGEETMGLLEANKKKLQMHDIAIQKYDGVLEELENQYSNLKEKYNENLAKLDGLKAQNEFAKNMETINKELKTHYSVEGVDFSSFDKIEEEINHKIYFEQDQNTQLAQPSIQDRVLKETRKSRFEAFVEQRKAGNAPQGIDAPKERIVLNMEKQKETEEIRVK